MPTYLAKFGISALTLDLCGNWINGKVIFDLDFEKLWNANCLHTTNNITNMYNLSQYVDMRVAIACSPCVCFWK